MQRERISENVYWFQSEVYALVTAGAIIGPQWAVVIDTLAMPDETSDDAHIYRRAAQRAGAVRGQHALPRRPLLGQLLFPRCDDHFEHGMQEADAGKRSASAGCHPQAKPDL